MCVFVLSLALLVGPSLARLVHTQEQLSKHAGSPAVLAHHTGRQPCFPRQDTKTSERREADAIATLPQAFRFWLREDAPYIISPEERCAFLHLASGRERDQFVSQFWLRRASDPESLENNFKQEHYRRIVFANQKFRTNLPGWQTDRGRIDITFGPPDKIESRAPGSSDNDREGGAGREIWHYRYLEGLGRNVELEFVDSSHSGEYRLTTPIKIRNEPPYTLPGISQQDRNVASGPVQSLITYVGPVPSPKIKFKDLEAAVTSRIIRKQLHFIHSVDFIPATHASTMVQIAIQIPTRALTPVTRDGTPAIAAEVFGRSPSPLDGSSKLLSVPSH